MKKNLITKVYGILVLIAVLSLVVLSFSKPTLTTPRIDIAPKTIELKDNQYYLEKDKTSPTGVKKVYTLNMNNIGNENRTLSFYAIHAYTKVYINNKLVYSMTPPTNNHIGKTMGCYWVIIPLVDSDNHKEIRIEETPVYKKDISLRLTLHVSNYEKVFDDSLTVNLPQIVLSNIALLLGVALMLIALAYKLTGKQTDGLGVLGMFVLCIGVWKINDTTFMPLIFTKNPRILSYISLSSFFLSFPALILYIKVAFKPRLSKLLDASFIMGVLFILEVYIAQLLNITDLREQLIVYHVIVFIAIATIVANILDQYKHEYSTRKAVALLSFFICVIGVVADFFMYYLFRASTGVLYTLVTFIAYVVVNAVVTTHDLSQKANLDELTGLMSRNRCNELIIETQMTNINDTVVVVDLNDLKKTNDSLGHEAGNQLIRSFALLLEETTPHSSFVGRYGGDEFMILLKSTTHEKVEAFKIRLEEAVKKYNEKNKLQISYAIGYAISNDINTSLDDLFKEADASMYINKKTIKAMVKK